MLQQSREVSLGLQQVLAYSPQCLHVDRCQLKTTVQISIEKYISIPYFHTFITRKYFWHFHSTSHPIEWRIPSTPPIPHNSFKPASGIISFLLQTWRRCTLLPAESAVPPTCYVLARLLLASLNMQMKVHIALSSGAAMIVLACCNQGVFLTLHCRLCLPTSVRDRGIGL